ncbi:hypothetical protein E2C01_026493 [Portunus trituberculatus]|uniref:Uncharacterized protein n=1 Tax=Portunus trituberculatus TaxID=210409 RepID=A0A5B7EFS2_PORTR|nr:hypothetical protein [Portunus trituberculatus]
MGLNTRSRNSSSSSSSSSSGIIYSNRTHARALSASRQRETRNLSTTVIPTRPPSLHPLPSPNSPFNPSVS